MRKREKTKAWPKGCLWPEPNRDGEGQFWDRDMAEMLELDGTGQELLEIREYFDELAACGRLNPDYSLNEDYEGEEGETGEDSEDMWEPEIGTDYWDDGFDAELWEEDLVHHINLLKIDACDPETDPVSYVRGVTGYSFINENLLRQAFTRRAFGIEYGTGDCEELEFFGDAVLNTVVSRELYRRFSDANTCTTEEPFQSRYSAGDLTAIRMKFVSRDRLAARAAELGLDRYILYGSGEEASDSAREDMMEALIGAVAADSDWDWSLLADIVDRLICLQLDNPDELVKKSAYEQLNSWHQKHFGSLPEYTVDRNRRVGAKECYDCTLRYRTPENDRGIRTCQRIDIGSAPTRSAAREDAARLAVRFLMNKGLWMRLDDAHMTPRPEDAINQLQELYQKKYLEAPPVYALEERRDGWACSCHAAGIDGWGRAASKTAAKKKAAFTVLVRMYMSAGLSNEGLEKTMHKMMTE